LAIPDPITYKAPRKASDRHGFQEYRQRNGIPKHWSTDARAARAASRGRREVKEPLSQTDIVIAQHRHQTPPLDEPSSASHVRSPSIQRFTVANILQHIRPCYLLVALGLLVIGGSLAVGLYFSIAKDRMGDGFTAAGWMTAVGTLILAAPMAKHYPHCKCWETDYIVLRQGHNAQV
jgi:hypothetical protein